MNRLKELREEAMLTVRELSERSGVSEDTITKIENGHRKGRSMTLRKLARALGTEPNQLFPENFERTIEAEESALEVLPQGALLGLAAGRKELLKLGFQDAGTWQATRSLLDKTLSSVAVESGLAYRSIVKRLSEKQRDVLSAVAQGSSLSASEVAERVGCNVSTACHDLAVLDEHGLVSSDESGQSEPTALGRAVAHALNRGELYFDEAMDHIATLVKAYEWVARVDTQRVAEKDALSLFMHQESIVELVRDIAAAAKPSPLARQAWENLAASGRKR